MEGKICKSCANKNEISGQCRRDLRLPDNPFQFYIVKSGSWINRPSIEEMEDIIKEALEVCGRGDRIINIQLVSEHEGSSRFYIYMQAI